MKKIKYLLSATLLSLFFFFPFIFANAQVAKDKIRIISAEYDLNYKVLILPIDALTGDYDGIIIPFDIDTVGISEITCISISWSSDAIDGGYSLEISPKQIFLRSNHDNPNPNYLYWLDSLSPEQYSIIKTYVNSKIKNKFEDYTNKYESSQSLVFKGYIPEKYILNDWEDKSYENLTKILTLLNKPLKKAKIEIKLPSKEKFSKIKPLLISSSEEEIREKINQKRR